MIDPVRQHLPMSASFVHHLDPRAKLVTALLLIIGIILTPTGALTTYPLLWTLIAALALTNRIHVWRLSRRAFIALPFTLAAITLLFTTPGRIIASPLGLVMTDRGLMRFGEIVIESWLAVHVGLLLSMTTEFTDLLWAFRALHVPGALVTIAAFMYRYLFTLKDEAETLIRARAARSGSAAGHRAGGRLLWRAQVTGSMLGSLFLRSYERSERVYAAMLSRGYAGHLHAPESKPLSWKSIVFPTIPILIIVLIHIVT